MLLALGCGGGGATAPFSASAEAPSSVSTFSPVDAEFLRPPLADRVMILVPEGTFVIGWDSGEADERPLHAVFLSASYVDWFEVIVGQYRLRVKAGGCEDPIYASSSNWDGFQDDTHPINCVNRQNAIDYCRWAGLRLPTEAEWEYAARGTYGRTFPWVYELVSDEANYHIGAETVTEPVGVHPSGASFYGLVDMEGNVWEWVAD